MAIDPGTRLGPYEILAPLGAGGMGEVYRARDTRLDREVAVKVLPQHLSDQPEVRARFEREARTISSLNHPHICTLYDVGRDGDTDYLVMELIDGETLTERLARGPLSTADTLRIGGEVADALDRAHRAGVVHRDLKPGNVMLTASGAKLMDFGLARTAGLAGRGEGSGIDAAMSPTISRSLTAEGTLVGTFQYMAPEQLEGREADARSDLWALGCVLYEMATGRRAFDGQSQASLIGAIMHAQPPPVSQVSAMSPPALERLVSACMAKNPADRIQSAHDVKLQLAWIADGGSGVAPAVALPRGRERRWHWITAAVTAVVAVAVTAAAFALLHQGPSASAPSQRFILSMASLDDESAPAVTADGCTVFYCEKDGGASRIMRRPLDSFDATPVEGTEDGAAPFLSPDGVWLGFVTATAIKKVPVEGGAPQTIANIPRVVSAEWSPAGTILFTLGSGSARGDIGVGKVSDAGGPITTAMPADSTHSIEYWLPEVLPDGNSFLVSCGAGSDWRIDVMTAGGERRTVLRDAFLGRYVPSGYLLWIDFASQALLAAPFDPGKAEVTGPAYPLTGRVDLANCFDCSAQGTIVFVPESGQGESDVVWVDRKGLVTPIATMSGSWRQPRISPDGDRLVVRNVKMNCELWMFDLVRGGKAQITSIGDNHNPVWAPDGRRLAYRSAQPGDVSIITIDVAAGRSSDVLLRNASGLTPDSWSPDGTFLACTKVGREIVILPVIGDDREPVTWRPDAGMVSQPAVSPDGHWIAYQSEEPGRKEVFLAAYPHPGRIYQVSTGGGDSPLWSRDGKELFFVTDGKLMSASVATEPDLRIGLPRELFGGPFAWNVVNNYDVSPDGSRFVMIRMNSETGGNKELCVVQNWEGELARRRR